MLRYHKPKYPQESPESERLLGPIPWIKREKCCTSQCSGMKLCLGQIPALWRVPPVVFSMLVIRDWTIGSTSRTLDYHIFSW